MANSVDSWLKALDLTKYHDAFVQHEVSFGDLSSLTEADLKEMGLPIGPRRRVLKAISEIDESDTTLASGPGDFSIEPSIDPVAERRQLTVMFCDLVGSTELSQQLDPEDLREIFRAYQAAAKTSIEKFNGHVAKYLGDGVLAYFGYPRAHEDDAEQAVRGGLELIASLSAVNGPEELGVRIGIATGPVVVGDLIGVGASEEHAVTGETPNLAARLQSAAEPNTVVVSNTTHALLYGLFDCVDLGLQRLKGFADEQRLWRVNGETAGDSRFEALHINAMTPFVGRASELSLLINRWETALSNEGQVVLLEGEAGIGKSRLADELRRAIDPTPHAVVRYQCSAHHTNSAFFPFVKQLEHAGDFLTQDDFEQRLDKLESAVLDAPARDTTLWLFATLLSLPTARYPALALEPQKIKSATIEAFRNQLIAHCRRAPTLVLFEDVHWIDPTSLDVLETLIDAGRQLPVLFILTHRPGFVSPWGGHGFVTQLRLSHLARRDGLSIIRDVAGGKDLPDEITRQILAKTDGVALFVEELTKTVLESGILREEPNAYVVDGALPELAIPSTLRDSLMARLDRLVLVKEIAQIGACIGREFSHALLQAITGTPQNELQNSLEQLVDNQLIFRRGTPPDAVYAFKHALVQDAAYESLLLSRRKAIHGSILLALEASHQSNPGDMVEMLALHAQRAEIWDKAVGYLRQAGAGAYARSASLEARAYYKQALGILDGLEESRANLEQAFEIRLDLRPVLNQLGEPRRMLDRLREAESIAERLNDERRRGLVCALITIAHSQLGELDEALEFGTRALEISDRLGDVKLRVLTTTYLELVHYYRGEYPTVVELAMGNLRLLPEEWVYEYMGASAPPSVYDRCWLIQSLAQIGRFADAITLEAEAFRIAGLMDHPFSIGQAHRAAVTLHILKGDWERANTLCASWIAGVQAGNVVIQLPWAIASSAWVLAQVGDADNALDRIHEGEQLLEKQAARGLIATCGWDYHALGRACLRLGQLDEARRLAERALEHSRDQLGFAAHALCLLGEISALLDQFDAQNSEAQYREALTLAEKQGMHPLIGHCRFGLGKVYRRTGKEIEAQGFFTTALTVFRDMDMGYWMNEVQVETSIRA